MHLKLPTILSLFTLATTPFAADYFPLAVGNTWNYSMTLEGVTGTLAMMVKEKALTIPDSVFTVNMKIDLMGLTDSSNGYMVSTGNDVFSLETLSDPKPYEKTCEHQPVAGHSWSRSTGEVCKVVTYGTITVPAGTFTSCYAIVQDGDTTEIFAPDVGMVGTFESGVLVVTLMSYTVKNAGSSISQKRIRSEQTQPVNMVGNERNNAMVNILGRKVEMQSKNMGNVQHLTAPGYYLTRERDRVRF